ncbi:MAG: hypothetical protein GTO45_15740 [Candidatus Aminicenantes bacterium]|nr:hypothetical protein [Candidatus Aminicenantes bacterium]NIM80224.1 hypothetical protein [Candidatus Aminicenantes bacterium]NIN19564.1 hypothetical protein [Candidatus Aminicenantes bacterium]NIN43458.1 hypothetical protein [Candidatus Aminicenantes bacterium]NIN86203.1 hypothetical protein [Candidatus Aminicenantes bacterium]
MAQRKLTINLTRSPEVLHDLIVFLLQRGLISEKEAHTIEQEKTDKAPVKKSRWELAAERFDSEGFLDGQGEEVKRLIRDFREGFTL